MHNAMLPASRRSSVTYDRLCFAIDRFLAGKLTPSQLQSWCFAHFDQAQSAPTSGEAQLWQLTLTNLDIFHRCDFHRSILEQSLAILIHSMDTTGSPCATPLTTSECFHEIKRTERRSGAVPSFGI